MNLKRSQPDRKFQTSLCPQNSELNKEIGRYTKTDTVINFNISVEYIATSLKITKIIGQNQQEFFNCNKPQYFLLLLKVEKRYITEETNQSSWESQIEVYIDTRKERDLLRSCCQD